MDNTLQHKKICFYGAGSMAEAIIKGLIDKKQASAEQLYVINRQNQARLIELHQRYGIHVDAQKKHLYLQEANVIILAMKPTDAIEALHTLRPSLNDQQLIISVIAGLSIATMSEIINLTLPIVRAMPNTSSSIGLGATGISFSDHTRPEHEALALAIFQSIGLASIVDEQQINIVTGLSGSGPAYIYYIIEAMILAGVEGGLSEEQAKQLTLQTVLGAANMLQITEEQPAHLRQKVTSPGGTTQAAIEVLDQHDFAAIIKQAIHRAAERAEQLGASISAISDP